MISFKSCLQASFIVSLTLCAAIGTSQVLAQAYPSKSIRIIAAAPPGGTTDLLSRMVGQRLSSSLGQQVIIDNRGGAGGNIAAELAAKAAPDGYTLLVVATSHAINTSLYSSLSYDPVKDFAPITQLAAGAYVLAVHPSLPAKSLTEFIALAKSKKGNLTYASSGTGQASHLGMELLKGVADFDAVHVPYKGTGPALVDAVAGQVDASLTSPATTLPLIKAGKLRAMAVTSLKRSAAFPDVPTVAESGYPGFEVSTWYGLLAPAGTPPNIVRLLYQEVAKILKSPEFSRRLEEDGADPVGSTPEEFEAYIKSEIVKWAKVVKQSGARVD